MKRLIAKLLGINTVAVTSMYRRINWTTSDGANWKEFLESNTGRKLLQAMENEEAKSAQTACMQHIQDRSFAAGDASGVRKSRALMLGLSTFLEVKQPDVEQIALGNDATPDDFEKLLKDVAREPVLGDY